MVATGSPRDVGLQFLREGSFAESIEFLLQALVDAPADIDLHLYLGYAYAREGEVDKSIEVLQQASSIAPESAKVQYNLGVAYHLAQNLTQAKEAYLRATNLDPSYPPAKNALAKLSGPSAGTDAASA
jgi:tetratricopeptide (TPR) repeat protein